MDVPHGVNQQINRLSPDEATNEQELTPTRSIGPFWQLDAVRHDNQPPREMSCQTPQREKFKRGTHFPDDGGSLGDDQRRTEPRKQRE